MTETSLDWSDLAFGSKKPLRELKATFIAAPREISTERFKQLVKTYLPQGNIILGLAKERYIDGFEDQPHFRTLPMSGSLQKVIASVNSLSAKHKIYTLSYAQRELKYILEKGGLRKVILVNGSWKHTFHTSSAYYTLVNDHIAYEMVSPFTDESEALAYEERLLPQQVDAFWPTRPQGLYDEKGMLGLAHDIAQFSYDYSFQTGVALGKKNAKGAYTFLATAFNKVVPFQTYALHYGASREKHFSPPNDLNHYDAIHAEVALILKVVKDKIDLQDTTLFINLLPCPSCARMFAETDIAEFVYSVDHSEGYAVHMLEKAGKTVRRIVTE
jgi:deoxycytidylate deaminase